MGIVLLQQWLVALEICAITGNKLSARPSEGTKCLPESRMRMVRYGINLEMLECLALPELARRSVDLIDHDKIAIRQNRDELKSEH